MKGDFKDPVFCSKKVNSSCAMAAAVHPTSSDIFASKLNFNGSLFEMNHEEQQKEIAQASFQKAAQWAPAGKGSFSGAMAAAMTSDR